MASTYSSDLKLELMATGENSGTWGSKTNDNLNLIQQAIAGYEAIALSDGGTVTLAMTNATISNARNMVIKFTGTLTGASIVTIPDSIEKFYIFDCSAVVGPTNLTIKTASGTGFTLNAAKIFAAYSDGTNLNEISLDTLGGSIAAADITGTIATGQIADDAVTQAKIADDAVGADQLASDAVVTASIVDSNVTTAKIADDAVTADKLANTTVTAGSYTASDITVDAQGRITAASDGSSGGGSFLFKQASAGPSSGNYTANPGATLAQMYVSGGGGGNGGPVPFQGSGGPGGRGGFGIVSVDVTSPFSQPFSVGSGGNNGNSQSPQGNSGNSGNATSMTGTFTANGGGGGGGASYRNPGSVGSAGNLSVTSPSTQLTHGSYPSVYATAGATGNNIISYGAAGGGTGLLLILENLGT
mgnify:CR=1 FL=1